MPACASAQGWRAQWALLKSGVVGACGGFWKGFWWCFVGLLCFIVFVRGCVFLFRFCLGSAVWSCFGVLFCLRCYSLKTTYLFLPHFWQVLSFLQSWICRKKTTQDLKHQANQNSYPKKHTSPTLPYPIPYPFPPLLFPISVGLGTRVISEVHHPRIRGVEAHVQRLIRQEVLQAAARRGGNVPGAKRVAEGGPILGLEFLWGGWLKEETTNT